MTFAHPLLLIRHGATAWNLADRFQGSTDTLLHSVGHDQALHNAKAAQAFIQAAGAEPEAVRIASSPLARARQSAAIIAERLGKKKDDITILAALREIALGRWEGMNNLKVKEVYYQERQSRKRDRWRFKPEGGESLAERADEVRAALASLPPHTIVVSHAGILRIARHVLAGEPVEQAAAATVSHEGLMHYDGEKLHWLFTTI